MRKRFLTLLLTAAMLLGSLSPALPAYATAAAAEGEVIQTEAEAAIPAEDAELLEEVGTPEAEIPQAAQTPAAGESQEEALVDETTVSAEPSVPASEELVEEPEPETPVLEEPLIEEEVLQLTAAEALEEKEEKIWLKVTAQGAETLPDAVLFYVYPIEGEVPEDLAQAQLGEAIPAVEATETTEAELATAAERDADGAYAFALPLDKMEEGKYLVTVALDEEDEEPALRVAVEVKEETVEAPAEASAEAEAAVTEYVIDGHTLTIRVPAAAEEKPAEEPAEEDKKEEEPATSEKDAEEVGEDTEKKEEQDPNAEEVVEEEVIEEMAALVQEMSSDTIKGLKPSGELTVVQENGRVDAVNGTAVGGGASIVAVPANNQDDTHVLAQDYLSSGTAMHVFLPNRLSAGEWLVYMVFSDEGNMVRSKDAVRFHVPDKPKVTDIREARFGELTGGFKVAKPPKNYDLLVMDGSYSVISDEKVNWKTFEVTGLAPDTYHVRYLFYGDNTGQLDYYDESLTTDVLVTASDNSLWGGVIVTGMPSAEFFYECRSDVMGISYSSFLNVHEDELRYKGYAPLPKGETLTAHVLFYPSDVGTQKIIWSSDNKKVATVDAATGVVKGVGAGTASIIASWKQPVTGEVIELRRSTVTVVDNAAKTWKPVKAVQTVRRGDEVTLEVQSDAHSGMEGYWNVVGPDHDWLDDSWKVDPNGRIYLKLRFNEAGVATVTAQAEKNGDPTGQTAVFTVNIDGPADVTDTNGDYQVVGWKDGKKLSGWASWNDTEKKWTVGDKARTIPGDWNIGTFYFDPDTGYAAKGGLVGSGNKRALINGLGAGAYIAPSGEKTVCWDITGKLYCVNDKGLVQTGWQITHSGEFYFDPVDAAMAMNRWVPRGNGRTWVNSDGYMDDGRFDTGPVLGQTTAWAVINDEMYLFDSKGIMKTGWVYLAWDGDNSVITSKGKADYWAYADPATGIVREGFFTIGGSRYYQAKFNMYGHASDTNPGDNHLDDWCEVCRDTFVETNKAEPNYGSFASSDGFDLLSSSVYYQDKNGAIVMDKLITEKATGAQFYVGAYGNVFTGERVVNGKYQAFEPALVKEPMIAPFGTFDNGAYAYLKSDGKSLVWYTDAQGKTKAKNTWITTFASGLLYVNGSGVPLTGPQSVPDRFDGTKRLHFFHAETGDLYRNNPQYVSYKGKNYAVDPDGWILINAWVNISDCNGAPSKAYGTSDWGHTDKNGAFQTGIVTIDGHKYGFAENGRKYRYGFTWKNKTYLPGPGPDSQPGAYYLDRDPLIAGDDDRLFYAYNSDCSFKMGWVTWKGKQFYCTEGSVFDDDSVVALIGGKGYAFDYNGARVSGWRQLYGILDLNGYVWTELEPAEYFYFAPGNGQMKTGWQTVPVPLWRDGAFVFDDNGALTGSSIKKKLYFKENGALARNETLRIDGKLYSFGPDGIPIEQTNWTSPFKEQYVLKNGQLATGRTKIGDQFYFFNKYNGLKETDVLRKSGGKWYYFGENGVQNTLMPDYYTIEEAPRVAHPVFNKDGSLKGFEDNFGKKITNASITSLDPWEMIQSNAAYNLGHIATLDKSGKPMTGIVTFNSYVNDEHYGKGWVRLMLEDDGSLYAQGSDYFPALLLIKSGKQYLCVGQGFVGSDALADGEFYVREVSDAFLPAADREAIKGLVQLSVHSYGEQGHLYIVANNRGEVQTSSSLSIDGGLLHTNRYGMPMELYSWLVKVGKEWIIPDFGSASTSIEVVVRGADMGGTIPAVMNVKGGVLTGFVDENGKALNGAYVLPWDDALVVLKNGLPQTGKQKISVGYGTILSLTIDPEAGWINTTFLGA